MTSAFRAPSCRAAFIAAAAFVLPVAGPALAGSPQSAPAVPAAPAAAPAAARPGSAWSEALWNAARTGDRAAVDRLLAEVPDGESPADTERVREAAKRLFEHRAETAKDVAKEREEKLAEMREAVKSGNATKALIGAAYLKFLSDDWKRDIASPDVKEAIALAERRYAESRTEGDWLLAEELLNRLRSLYEGTPDRTAYDRYDEALETDVGRRVLLVLEYAPRAWHELRRKQYDRLDEKDRKEPFPEFNEKSADDWRQALEGINERILAGALSQVAAQHLENIGWKPLILGGLGMVERLATTPALRENFPSLGDAALAGEFARAVRAQSALVEALKPEEVDARTFGRVFRAVKESNAATVKLPEEVVVREFGNGATAIVTHDFEDPYTEIVWPDRMRRFNQMIKGNFVGVGIMIRHNERREIVIVNPLDGSPAKRAGIKPGDRIAAVDGKSAADWPVDKAVDVITGPAGTTVRLSIAREGQDAPLEVPLVRERIKMYSVQGWRKTGYNERSEPMWDWFIDPQGGIGYVRLTGFNEDTFTDFLKAMREMSTARPINGLVLDLRGNPGGLLTSAVSFVNVFLRDGRIVSVEDRNGEEVMAYRAQRRNAPLADVPTVVLINESSASASEIVSGALEAHDAAVVIGERSYGKGSVQEVHELGGRGPDAQSTVKYTVQHYLLPPKPGQAKGRLVHRKPGSDDWGVVPDYAVKLSPSQVEEINAIRASADDMPEEAADGMIPLPDSAPVAEGDAVKPAAKEPRDPAELVQKGVDPQLETAVLLLQANALGRGVPSAAAPATPAQRTPAAGKPADKARS
ncbi:MAG: S41 family peptidase [Phycisphaerales bacterium]